MARQTTKTSTTSAAATAARQETEAKRAEEQRQRDETIATRQREATTARERQIPMGREMVAGPHDFDGTSPDEIRKMAVVNQVGNLPLGPGQVTGGIGLRGARANTAPDQPSGGDRTPGQSGNPSAEDQDAASRRSAGL